MPIVESRWFSNWAPVAARILVAIQLALGALFKVVGFSMEVAQTAAVGVPLPAIAVSLAFILEVVGVISLLLGWYLRPVAAVLSLYVAFLAVLFYHNFSDPMTLGLFFSHFGLIAALLYIAATGARYLSVDKN